MAGDDTGGALEDSNAQRRRASDRQQDANSPSTPASDDVASFMSMRATAYADFEAGFDPRDKADMERRTRTLQWADRKRAKEEDRQVRTQQYRIAVISGLVVLFVGYFFGIVRWVGQHIPASWWHGTGLP